MPVDRFCSLDTIGTCVKSGKIGLTGRTHKVDTIRRVCNRDVTEVSLACRPLRLFSFLASSLVPRSSRHVNSVQGTNT